jgi:hypothetical protein
VLTLALLVAYVSPGVQGRLTEYPSHPLGWVGWALALFGIAAQLLLLQAFGGGGLVRWLFALFFTGIWLGSLLLLHLSLWRLIDDRRDFAPDVVTVTEQRLPIIWARHHRTKRGFDHYSARTLRLKDELYLGQADFDRLRAGRAVALDTELPINGRWCFSLKVEQGLRGAVRILGKEDGRLPPGSVVPCQAGR